MPRLHIGKRSSSGALERYSKRFDLVEVRPTPDAPLRPATLRKWRTSVPASFVFSVVLPSIITEFKGGPEADAALSSTLETARVLESPIIVVPTAASLTPTVRNRKRLEELVSRLPHDVVRIVWEPAGLWETEDAAEFASKLGITLSRDASQEKLPRGPVAYSRLRGLGESARLSEAKLDRIVANLRGHRDVYIVVETERPATVAKELRDRLSSEPDSGTARATRQRAHVMPLRAEDEEQE